MPNGLRLSCGALKKDPSLNLRAPASFKRLLGGARSFRSVVARVAATYNTAKPIMARDTVANMNMTTLGLSLSPRTLTLTKYAT